MRYKIIFIFILIKRIRAYGIYFLNKITNYQIEKIRFYKKTGYKLYLKNPRSFNEKIVWKKIYDRNPLLPITSDKLEVRSFIKKQLGDKVAKEILVPLLYVTDKPKTIPFDDLAKPYIIKPNHASGFYIIAKNGEVDKKKIIRTCQKWLRTNYGFEKLEWAYQAIKPKIVIEKMLQENKGSDAKDFKFHMFHGKCCFIEVNFDRIIHSGKYLTSFFNAQWNRLYKINPIYEPGPDLGKPDNFDIMLMLADKLSAFFDYVRVDLYNINGKIFFGELTHYPFSGTRPFDPISLDFELGEKWILKPQYWKQYRWEKFEKLNSKNKKFREMTKVNDK